MAPLTAFFICSLDLRLTDGAGDFGWAEPPEDVHAFANERDRPVGTYLYGRRMWETMRFWETMPEEDSVMGEYGRVWRGADKVVYSRTLDQVDTARTRLLHDFDPEAVQALKAEAAAPLTIGGADLAAHAFAAGLVDELELLLVPVLVGSGPRVLPDGVRGRLDLREQRTFPAGWVHLRYGVAAST
jgi:dihydrofolate reductase